MRQHEAAKDISNTDQVKHATRVLNRVKAGRKGRQFKLVRVDARTVKEVEIK